MAPSQMAEGQSAAGETAEPSAEQTPGSDPDPSAQPAPAPGVAESDLLDLLRAVPTQVAVSSAHNEELRRVELLVDDNITSTWSSKAGDLEGTWFEVRLPANSYVARIEMTVGFTDPTNGNPRDGRQLRFAKNHRVKRVRLSRDGEALGEFDLDPNSTALQAIPVSGPGGVYRVTVLALEPGSEEDYRETCISKVRVMGTAPGAEVESNYPVVGIGQLPEPREWTPLPAEAIDREFRRGIPKLHRRFQKYLDIELTASPAADENSAPTHRSFFRAASDFVSRFDQNRGGRLRGMAARFHRTGRGPASELLLFLEAMRTIAASGSSDLPCYWTKQEIRFHAYAIFSSISHSYHFYDSINGEAYTPDAPGLTDEQRYDARDYQAAHRGITAAYQDFALDLEMALDGDATPKQIAERMLPRRPPEGNNSYGVDHHAALQHQWGDMQRVCGWE